jgi:uncharacterized membrane protein
LLREWILELDTTLRGLWTLAAVKARDVLIGAACLKAWFAPRGDAVCAIAGRLAGLAALLLFGALHADRVSAMVPIAKNKMRFMFPPCFAFSNFDRRERRIIQPRFTVG